MKHHHCKKEREETKEEHPYDKMTKNRKGIKKEEMMKHTK